jgi:iron complex outermembrane recepter protein
MHGLKCVLFLSVSLAQTSYAQQSVATSEKDFLEEVPLVLSVSRLSQRLDETPGAVTVLDRNMIRLSGARDVADLLRLVPGFQTSNAFEGDAPQASYHGAYNGYSSRIQVLVDGRAAYSPYLIGSIGPGLQLVAMNDIERIEVLRGSNSASYGARAFLGVINIVTRDPAETLGAKGSISMGDNGIQDTQASLGWAAGKANFRLGMDRRYDGGLAGSAGADRITRMNFRMDYRPTAVDEVQFRLGGFDTQAGLGYLNDPGRPLRERFYDSRYLQVDWRRNLSLDSDLALGYAHARESYQDAFVFPLPAPLYGTLIDIGGYALSDTLSLQHTLRMSPQFRLVWGTELRREQVVSKPLYNTAAIQQVDYTRLFGNFEWRFADDSLVLNAGGLLERDSRGSESFAPRVMLNWHMAAGQTLRVGASKAYRPPSSYETSSNIQFSTNGILLQINRLSRGNVQAESVLSRELGYLGEFPKLALSLDVRAFHEQIGSPIKSLVYGLPAGSTLFTNASGISETSDYVNSEGFLIHGLEYQLKWRPWMGAQLVLGQSLTTIDSADQVEANAAPKSATTLMWTQKLPGGLDFTLTHQAQSLAKLHSAREVYAFNRTDVRVGWPFRMGSHKADLSLVVQNLGPSFADFDNTLFFQRRAYVNFRVEQ